MALNSPIESYPFVYTYLFFVKDMPKRSVGNPMTSWNVKRELFTECKEDGASYGTRKWSFCEMFKWKVLE
jgi:hypothetical protein